MWLLVNPLTALLCLVGMIGYAVVYTRWLKWIGPQNIVLGGAAGAVRRWSAGAPSPAASMAGSGPVPDRSGVDPAAFLVAGDRAARRIRRRQGAHAADGARRRLHQALILGYTLALFPVSLLPGAAGIAGPLYLAGAVLLSGSFVFRAAQLLRSDQDRDAMALFRYSITYLSALFALLLLDHF